MGGINSVNNGGTFFEGAADGFLDGTITGAVTGAITGGVGYGVSTGVGIFNNPLVKETAESVVETTVGAVDTLAHGGTVTAKDLVQDFALNMIMDGGGASKADDVLEVATDKKTRETFEDVVDGLDNTSASRLKKTFTDNPFDEAGNLKPNVKYQTGEFKYNYETDVNGRISNWNTDDLRLTERADRLKHDANTPGKLAGDHAGHLAGDRFGGSSKLDNIVSQSQNVNLSQYKKLENEWADAIKEGKKVTTNVDIKYDGNGVRPIEFNVEYTIDGKYYSKNILN